jgi:predicted enzyme related to lactoylglutathione lyase
MENVLGIGGFFFRAENPEQLGGWYEKNFGINLPPPDYNALPWMQDAGPTIFAPFPKTTEMFGNPERQWMLNFRVSSLDAMVEQLRGNGIEVTVDSETYPNGRFAQLNDPEGNPIQLWEEARPDTTGG